MPSLNDVKLRKNTVLTIQKITKAMELVANSKIRSAKRNYDKVQEYSQRIEDVFYNLDYQIKDWNKIFKIDNNQPRIFIIITSDIGMCGSYNSNIVKLAKTTITKDDYVFIVGSVGKKALQNYFHKDKILGIYDFIGDEPNYYIISKMLDILCPMLYNSKIRSIHILETEFLNSISFEPKDKKIFPFSRRKREELSKKNQINKNTEFEPNAETVVKKSLPIYIGAIIFSSLANSKVSEMSSRRLAMENASNNALDIISNLEKEYNRLRQEKITQEITEIVAGADNES